MKYLLTLTLLLNMACGIFDKKENDDDLLKLLILGILSNTATSTNDGSFIEMDVTSGNSVTSNYNATASTSVQNNMRALATGTDNQTKVEVSVVDPDGMEQSYLRNGDGSLSVAFTPSKSGRYRINFKNNSDTNVNINHSSTTGSTVSGNVSNANQSAQFGSIFLKGYVGFSTRCNTFSSSVTASTGNFFVQPIIFLGKIGSDKKVTDISSATIKISYNNKSITLQRLDEMNTNLYDNPNNPSNSIPSSDKTNKLKYVKSYYQSLFGAAGELYTIGDTFNKSTGTVCSSESTLPLGTSNFGNSIVTLSINDTALGINESFNIRPVTNGTDFGQYFKKSDGTSFSDFSTCSYNTTTGSSDACAKTFSLKDPPYLQLTSFTPETAVNAPTRLLFFGANLQKTFLTKLIENSSALTNGTMTSLTIDGCLNNGGINAVKIAASEKVYLPLKEFNLSIGDISKLKYIPGSYTHLKKFYQGNADLSGQVDLPVCIPANGQSCPSFKTISIKSEKCKVKVDSGIIVGAFSSSPSWTSGENNYFIYPDNLGGGLSARIVE
ncbi:MAG: hypothetical protein SH817_00565 [Leptospira sp.]|nr:hypothetical protein [Leptospira sp.]